MIHESYDNSGKPMLTPEAFYGKHEAVCDVCVITFSYKVMEWALAHMECEKIAVIGSVNGGRPIYLAKWNGERIAFYMTRVSSAAAAVCLEEARCLTGCTKYVICGSCGSLDKALTDGKLIVPTHAYRDEGLSYHYLPAEDYVDIRCWEQVAEFMEKNRIPYAVGRTWTTDAIYRETPGNAGKRREEGCISVEMELAGLQAVCDYHDLSLFAFLYSSDCLGEEEWHNEILGKAEEWDAQIQCFTLAMNLAAELSGK